MRQVTFSQLSMRGNGSPASAASFARDKNMRNSYCKLPMKVEGRRRHTRRAPFRIPQEIRGLHRIQLAKELQKRIETDDVATR